MAAGKKIVLFGFHTTLSHLLWISGGVAWFWWEKHKDAVKAKAKADAAALIAEAKTALKVGGY